MKQLIVWDKIVRQNLRVNPTWGFIFGDNLECKGSGGQAREMRGEPNAIGIPTKRSPGMLSTDFMSDSDLLRNMISIDTAMERLRGYDTVVMPKAGIGTGLALLESKAPVTFYYLQIRLWEDLGWHGFDTAHPLAVLWAAMLYAKTGIETWRARRMTLVELFLESSAQVTDIRR